MTEIGTADIDRLSHIFDNTTATYKFYWMLALLDVVREGKAHQPVSYIEMVARMVGKAWQPLMYGEFSFGKCDSLICRINELIVCSPLHVDSMEEMVKCYIIANSRSQIVSEIVKKLTKYVPTRFLYPWIGTCTDSQAETLSAEADTRCLYSIKGRTLIVNDLWMKYLTEQNYILEGFTFHHLYRFIEKRNPDFILPLESSITADGSNATYKDSAIKDFASRMAAESGPLYRRTRLVRNIFNAPFYNYGTINGNVNNNPKK